MPADTMWAQAAVHARLPAFRSRWERAQDDIASFADEGPTMICWSGGKDSTALALAAERSGVHVAQFACGLEFPGADDWMDDLARRRRWPFVRARVGDAVDVMVDNGSWDHDAPMTGYDAGAWWEVTMAGPQRIALEWSGATQLMWGLRSDEAARRAKLLARNRGRFRDGATRMWVLCPLRHWSVLDVWAAHWHCDEQPNPVYARLSQIGCPPDMQRLGHMVGADGRAFGRFVWLRRGWPEEFAALAARLPRITEWA